MAIEGKTKADYQKDYMAKRRLKAKNGISLKSSQKQGLENAPKSNMSSDCLLDLVRPPDVRPVPLDLVRPVTTPNSTGVLTQQQIDSLPVGVARPGSGATVWSDTKDYHDTIYRLLTWTIQQLADAGQWIPSWKYKEQDCAVAG